MPTRFTPPKSMQFVAEEIPSFIKARVHHRKAAEQPLPHFAFLERWQGFELLYRDVAPLTRKHDAFVFARDATLVDVVGACLAQLSRPRVDAILSLPDIGDLNVAVSKRVAPELIGENQLLQELGITVPVWLDYRKDLRFALKSNTIKGLKAMSCLLLIVRAACDPKVKKTDNLVKASDALEPANRLLKDCVTHLIEHFQKEANAFHNPAVRVPPRKV